ncbi:hypothetical protein HPB52_002618 [Rhipicephalus sanguineus]|uniref:Uncharacterized protein n=1 Tax=Rhipicephalus sanguineus TaxID=34632 RepID=A0A9D4T4S0_RHISA|nr:hypothetical protein HPB52_002618 [Rhipicephalus sanguineus]
MPSEGHVKRMCRILRSEAFQQVRFFTDCLQIVNYSEMSSPSAQRRLLTSFGATWSFVCSRSRRQNSEQGKDVKVLEDASVPKNVADLLKLGPKFCEHPDLDKTELLSLVRTAAGKAKTDEVDRCIREGVDCLPQRVKKGNTVKLRSAVAFLRDAGLKLLLSEKEGGFVVNVWLLMG